MGASQRAQKPAEVTSEPLSSAGGRKLKLKELIEQVNEDKCEPLSERAVSCPGSPAQSVRVFFCLFGPHGHRTVKNVRLTRAKFNNNDELMMTELCDD